MPSLSAVLRSADALVIANDGSMRSQLDLARRARNFDEVHGGLTEDDALLAARRCLSGGNGFECDNCCGVCVAECPCGAIEMVAEDV